jgi:DNA-binding ferritin-like protein
MRLDKLVDLTALLTDDIWSLHHNVIGPEFWEVHKVFDEIYNKGNEAYDRIAECAVHHNERVGNRANAAKRNPDWEVIDFYRIPALPAVLEARIRIRGFLEALASLDDYDDGVDNMTGDLYETWSWIAEFQLGRFIPNEGAI